MTQNELKSLFSYDEETGLFTRLISKNGKDKVGDIAGTVSKSMGYRIISIMNKKYQAHRLVYLYVYGYLPDKQIDHINGIRHDNRLKNLREADFSENAQNRKNYVSLAKSGLIGAHTKTDRPGIYFSCICINNKKINLGTFKSAQEAHEAYKAKRKEIHPFFNE